MPKAKKALTPVGLVAIDEQNLKLIEGEKALAEQRAVFEKEKADFEEKQRKSSLKPSELPEHEYDVKNEEQRAGNSEKTNKLKIKEQVLKNTAGEDVPVADYFFAEEGETAVAPGYFNKACGFPVDREDITEIFNRVFKISDNFLLLKTNDKEIYGVLVPLKFATMVSHEDESRLGDCQYHAVSFIPDGSVNLDKFEREMKKIAALIGYDFRG